MPLLIKIRAFTFYNEKHNIDWSLDLFISQFTRLYDAFLLRILLLSAKGFLLPEKLEHIFICSYV